VVAKTSSNRRAKTPATGRDRKAPAPGRDRKPEGVAGDRWLDDFLPYQLYRVTNKLNARLLTRLRAMRINPSQWRVLSVLKAYGAMSINDIVAATIIAQPTVSRVVVRLERAGKVSRRAAPHDSRVMQISLTPEGVAAFKQIVPTALRHQDIAFRGISRKSIAQLVDTLLTIERNIESGK
jgi:DNA-binding MarR family transcriptional regulator